MHTLHTEIAMEPRVADEEEALAPFYAAGAGVLRTTHDAELVRLARQYAAFAGSTRNALSLVGGLRHGSPVALHGEDGDVSFTPPTAPMGWSRVQRILNLARAGLTSLGIHAPQPSQIAAALVGGAIAAGEGAVHFPGVLKLHSERIDWTRIAHAFALAVPAGAMQHQ